MSRLIMLLFCCSVVCKVRGEPELKGSPGELAQYLSGMPRTARVVGEGEVKVPADRAVVTLKITTDTRSLATALRLNQETRAKLLELLKSKEIPSEHVQASKFSSTPKFGWFSEKAKSYQVENVVKVTVNGEKEFQTVGTAVDTLPEVQYMGIELEYPDKDAAKQKAIAKACDNAAEHKQIYETKFGVRLAPKGIVEGFAGQNIYEQQKLNQAVGFNSSMASGGTMPSLGNTASSPATISDESETEESSSAFGELIFKARIVVEYLVETK